MQHSCRSRAKKAGHGPLDNLCSPDVIYIQGFDARGTIGFGYRNVIDINFYGAASPRRPDAVSADGNPCISECALVHPYTRDGMKRGLQRYSVSALDIIGVQKGYGTRSFFFDTGVDPYAHLVELYGVNIQLDIQSAVL